MRVSVAVLLCVIFAIDTNAAEPVKYVPVSDASFEFHPSAAKELLDKGVEQLVFIRRFTYTSSHTYTEYLDNRWNPGGAVCVLNLRTGKVREVFDSKTGIIGWLDVSFDGTKIVFDYKANPDDGYRIYEINADGTVLKQLTFPTEDEDGLVKKYRRQGYHHGTDDIDPCYLPDGGIAFTTTRCQYGILCDSPDIFTVRNIYRMNADGTNLQRLTVSPLSEAKPSVMSDGRILYSRWEYVDKAAGNVKALWSMNPDGSGTAEVYGNDITFPETMVHARQIPGEPNKIVMIGTSHWRNSTVGSVVVVDTTKYIRSENAMQFITDDVKALAHDGFHFKNTDGQYVYNTDGKAGRLFRNPYPLNTELFIVSHKPQGLPWNDLCGYDLALVDGSGRDTVLLKDTSCSLWSPYPLKARTKPPVPTGNAVDKDLAAKGLAQCIVTDVYTGMDNVKRGTVKYIRVLEQLGRPWAARNDGNSWGMSHSAVGDGFLSVKIQYGIVPVEEDGSANFVVPANRAIYFQALDKNYRAVQTERTYVNYHPGEVRGCVGCHETPDMTPAKKTSAPKALQRPYSVPSANQTFDYARQIQPILDKQCGTCHTGEKAKLDLRGTETGVYSVSYNNLMRLAQQKQLLGNRNQRNENNASNSIVYIPPYNTGALSSPLYAWLANLQQTTWNNKTANDYTVQLAAIPEHKDVKLSADEKLVLSNWLDVNAPFYPSYWGYKNVKFKDNPHYRPVLSFDEAKSETSPF